LKEVLAHFKKLMDKESRTPPKDAPVPSLKMRDQPVLVERTKQCQQFETKGTEYEENIKTTYLEALNANESAAANCALADAPEMSDLVGKRVAFKWDEPWGWSEGIVLNKGCGRQDGDVKEMQKRAGVRLGLHSIRRQERAVLESTACWVVQHREESSLEAHRVDLSAIAQITWHVQSSRSIVCIKEDNSDHSSQVSRSLKPQFSTHTCSVHC